MATENRTEIRQSITDNIIRQFEQGDRPWSKSWSAEHAAGRITTPLRWNGEKYRGINFLVLWLTVETKGFTTSLWLKFRQAKELGRFIWLPQADAPFGGIVELPTDVAMRGLASSH